MVEALAVSVLEGGHPLLTCKASMVRHCRGLSHNVHVLFRMQTVLEVLQNGITRLVTALNLAE